MNGKRGGPDQRADGAGALWRGLEDLAPGGQSARSSPALSRRELLLGGGSLLGLASLARACTCVPPENRVAVPLVRDQPELSPGRPLRFATALSRNGHAIGVVVNSVMGRPIKVEGNPDHPSSLGATDIFCQAEIDRLYHPERSQAVRRAGEVSTWEELGAALRAALGKRADGSGVRVLSGEITSPTLRVQMAALLRALPGSRWHRHEPIGSENTEAGARIAFGALVRSDYQLDRASVILALDSDFMSDPPGRIRYARHFSDGRRLWRDAQTTPPSMNRLYVVEPVPTVTGSSADERLRLRRSEIGAFAAALGAELGLPRVPGFRAPSGKAARWVSAVARDLSRHRGHSAVIVGEAQPPAVHALGHAINGALGNLGQSVLLLDDSDVGGTRPGSLAELIADLRAGKVELLFILESNPVYSAPADLHFAEALKRARLSVHLGLERDETAVAASWHVPALHELESWGDVRGHDGTVSLLQPLIAPLYQGRSAGELLALLEGDPLGSDLDRLKQIWMWRKGLDENAWRQALDRGFIAGSAAPIRQAAVHWASVQEALAEVATAGSKDQQQHDLELVFQPDPCIWDGRYASVGRLQELAKPVSQLTWDNPIFISPTTAIELNLRSEDEVDLEHRGRRLRAPVWVQPGQADGCLAVTLGYGRWQAGHYARERGLNAYALRRSRALWVDFGARLRRTGDRHRLASTQQHQRMEGRDLILEGLHAKEELRAPAQQPSGVGSDHSLYPEEKPAGRQWGMVIDLATCIGCGVCNIACQEENNIAVVGRKEVLNTREMYWIRIDRYYRGDPADPEILSQPVPCMQCEKAPCEVVCPTGATQHSSDGLNDMTYNRCIGTRYCSNNCPYKVRRFNFFYYHDQDTPVLELARNPEVTVRMRGVMEKCTYCVQRIRNAEIQAELKGQPIADGELQTACQQACPTNAIVFGDLADKGSRVSQLRSSSRRYELLADLNTQPRTSYLTRLRNRNPELG